MSVTSKHIGEQTEVITMGIGLIVIGAGFIIIGLSVLKQD